MTDHEEVKLPETSVAPEAEGLSFGFWAKIAGLVVLGAIGLFILLILLTRAAYAYGALVTFGVFVAVLLSGVWLRDRRAIKRAEEQLNS
jgi:uncharacterized membrane protein